MKSCKTQTVQNGEKTDKRRQKVVYITTERVVTVRVIMTVRV